MMLRLMRGEKTLAQTQKALFIVSTLTAVLFLSFVGAGLFLLQHQISADKETIRQIQKSRLEVCHNTYRTLSELIAASFDHGDLTFAERNDLVLYERIVNPARCEKDVK